MLGYRILVKRNIDLKDNSTMNKPWAQVVS